MLIQQRGCPLLSIQKYPTLDSQKKRLLELGFDRSFAYDMNNAYNKLIDQKEKRRIERLEMLDELEEWNMIQAHYFISIGINFSKSNDRDAQIIQSSIENSSLFASAPLKNQK